MTSFCSLRLSRHIRALFATCTFLCYTAARPCTAACFCADIHTDLTIAGVKFLITPFKNKNETTASRESPLLLARCPQVAVGPEMR